MIHVSANEAGRNSCFLRRYECGIQEIKNAVKQNAPEQEILQMLDILTMYARRTLKIRPTINY